MSEQVNEPIYGPTVERAYSRLPQSVRELDAEQPYPVAVSEVTEAFNYVRNPSMDGWVGGQEVGQNLYPNPSMEADPGQQGTDPLHVATNLVTNPRGRNTSGMVTIRENLVPNPAALESGTSWEGQQSGTTPSLAYEALGGPTAELPTYVRSIAQGELSYLRANRGYQPISPDTTYEVRLFVRATGGEVMRINWVERVAGGGTLLDTGLAEVPVSGEWTELVAIVRTLPETGSFRIGGEVRNSLQAGHEVHVTGAVVSEVPGPYFDGDTWDGDSDLTPEWTGTPGASTSRLVAPKPVGWEVYNQGHLIYYSQAHDAVAVVMDGVKTSNSVRAAASLSYGHLVTGVTEIMSPQETMRVRLPHEGADVPGIVDVGGGKWHTIRRQWTSIGSSQVRPTMTMTDAGVLYVRSAAVRGAYQGPFFDGRSNIADHTTAWTGTVDNSTSTLTVANPSERTLFRNLVTNPRGRNTSGTVVVRENLAVRPWGYATRNNTTWAGTTEASVSDHPLGIPTAYESRVATGSTSSMVLSVYRPGDVPSSETPRGLGTWVKVNAPGYVVRTNAVGTPSPLVANEWTWVVSPDTHVGHLMVQVYTADGSLASPEHRAWITGTVVHENALVTEYFDGSTSPDPDLTSEWTGTPGESASRLVGPSPVGWAQSTVGVVYYSETFDSLAMVTTGEATYSHAGFGVGSHASATSVVEFLDVRPFAVFEARARWDYAQTNWTRDLIAPVTIRSTEVDTSSNMLVQRNATEPGDIIYFRAAAIPDTYFGPYFDGDTDLASLNHAYGNQVSANGEVSGDLQIITNGLTTTVEYATVVGTTEDESYVTVDLGYLRNIDRLRIWRFYGDGRSYYAPRTEVSPDGTTWYTVYDPEVQGTYQESVSGRTINFPARQVRYIRDWAGANTVDREGRWVEIQAFDTSGDYEARWEGEPHNSASVIVAPTPALEVRGRGEGRAITTQKWASSGERSLRMIPTGSNADLVAFPLEGLTTGQTYTVSATIRIEHPQSQSGPYARTLMLDHDRKVQAPNTVGAHRIALIFTARAGDEIFFLGNGGAASDADVYWDDISIQHGRSSEFYWGNQNADSDFDYSWIGTPNSSATRKVSLRNVVNVTPRFVTSAIPVQSRTWAEDGETSLRLVSNNPTINNAAVLVVPAGELEEGKTYTASATTYAEGLLPVGAQVRAIMWHTSKGWSSTPAAQQIGKQQITLSFTVPAGATDGGLYLTHGGRKGDPDVWWDSLIVTDGDEQVAYFDGTMEGHEWTGAQNHSTSRRLPREFIPGGYPLKKYLSSIVGIQDDVDALVARFMYLPEDEREQAALFEMSDAGRAVPLGATSDIVDPRTADSRWVPWISQLFGINPNAFQGEEQVRTAVLSGGGFHAGSRESIERAVKAILEGDEEQKDVILYRSTSDINDIGGATMWDLMIITRSTNTPDPEDVINAVIDAGVKPAGVRLHTRTFVTTWENVEGFLPTWQQWEDAGSWRAIEQVGF